MIDILKNILKIFPGLPDISMAPAQMQEGCTGCGLVMSVGHNLIRSLRTNRAYCSKPCFDVREGQ